MSKSKMPLHYAILKSFLDETPRCAQDVVDALKAEYGDYKLLNTKDVEETLATAKENGLLDEASCDLDDSGNLRMFYKVNEFGIDMMGRYL